MATGDDDDGWAELERRQMEILRRISVLEVALLPREASGSPSLSLLDGTTMDGRLSSILRSMGAWDFVFRRVPADYYDKTLEYRRECLHAHSIHHLCKSIVMVNTQAPANVTDCRDRNNSKYYVVVVQYTAKLNAESLKSFLHELNNGNISKKKINMRLAPEEESLKLTGFEHNAVTCVGMKTDIPVILDEAIAKLDPDFFWLGGGEVDLKLGIRTPQFIEAVKPFIVNCSN